MKRAMLRLLSAFLAGQLISFAAFATTPCPSVSAMTTPPAEIHDANVAIVYATFEKGESITRYIEGCMLNDSECSYTSHRMILNISKWKKNAVKGLDVLYIISMPTCQHLEPMEPGKSYDVYGYIQGNAFSVIYYEPAVVKGK